MEQGLAYMQRGFGAASAMPRRSGCAGRLAWLALVVGLAALRAGPASADAGGRASTALTIEGEVAEPRTWTPEALAAQPAAQDLADVPILGHDGRVMRVMHGYRGVRLIDLIPEKGIRADDHNALKRTWVVATATDGYVAIFSWGELYNSGAGGGVWIVFAKDGKPIPDDEGRLALISTTDVHTGPRHVRWLKAITVHQLPAP